MTIIEQLKAEIERRQKENYKQEGSFSAGRVVEDADILSFLDTLESEKPINQERLDENIKRYIEDCGWKKDSTIPVSFVWQIASHFYDLGCRRTAEKYDEIEYTRQRTEESIPKDLEEVAEHYASVTDPEAHGIDFIREIFIAGAKWDREKMMKDAVEADVNIYRDLAAGKSWAEFVAEMPINNLDDKVLVIVLPKEDQK